MVNKKKRLPLPRRNLEACQDLYEKAMVGIDEGKPATFKRHMTEAIVEGEKLLAASISGQPGEDSTEDLTEFVAQCCFEMGTFLMEENDFAAPDFDMEKKAAAEEESLSDADVEEAAMACARQARPYLERAVDLYRGHADVSQSFCRPAVLSLSTLYAVLHEHQKDIELCQEFVGRLIKQYNQWTPLQNDILGALAGAYNNCGQLDEAEKTYKEIVSICKTNYGDDNERTKEAQDDLSEFLQDRNFGICPCKAG